MSLPFLSTDHEKPEMQHLSEVEARAFLEATESDRLYAMYVLTITTGMRQGELFGLKWSDVDLETGELSVRRTANEINGEFVVGPPKSKKSRRRIKLSALAVTALHEHRKAMMAEGKAAVEWVFCDSKGGLLRRQNVQRRSFKPALKRAGLADIRFHDLRHTAATLMLLWNINPKVVSEMLGHSRVSITLDLYSHVMPTMQQVAAEAMDSKLVKQPA